MTDYKNLKVYEKSQVGGLTKALANVRFNTNSNHDAWDALFARAKSFGLEIDYNDANIRGEKLMFTKARKITRAQTEFGKAWLKNYFFKKDGKPRGGMRTQYVTVGLLRIAKSVARFELVGVLVVASDGWYPCQVLPIYRTYNRKGEYFDYSPVHWGQPVIMEG